MTKVFLVDDEIVIREGIRSSFPWDETEYTLVGEAPDGEVALTMIRDTNPDILITDIRMPFMDGLELCKAVRTQMPWIGIVILSGYDEFEYARQAIQLGVREYLLKPITAEELKQVLDRVSEKLKQEKLEQSRPKENGESTFLRDMLIGSLYAEESTVADPKAVIEQLRNMGVNLNADRYAVIDAAFDSPEVGQSALQSLAETSGGIIFVTNVRSGARILVLGDSDGETEERAYAYASSAANELERQGCGNIRISIGEIVRTPGEILNSMNTARHIRHSLEEQNDRAVIVGVRELNTLPSDKKTRSVSTEARFYLSQHFTDPNLMLQDAAKAVNMSNSRFSTVFSQETGKTFTEYLTALRMNKAKELLRNTDKRSSEIAFEVGYNDSHYFSYLFKKNVGMTPGEYRAGN